MVKISSFCENSLKELGRKHRKEDVFRVVSELKQEGFSNISIDYIYGVHSDIREIKEDINTFLELDIPHISCYSLIIENNTVFSINNRNYIEEDIEYEMYNYIRNTLVGYGYNQYEISNYAKKGYCSIHNLNYWDNGNYYGFGLGAVSYLFNRRISNTKNLSKYLVGNYVEGVVCEDKNTDMANTFMLGFRKTDGIDIVSFKNKYDVDVLSMEVVRRLIDEGKLILCDNRLFIAPDYLYLSNEIILEFI